MLIFFSLQTLDTSIPAHPSMATTKMVFEKILIQIDKKNANDPVNSQNIKTTELYIESCEVLARRKL